MARLVVTHPILGTLDTRFNPSDYGIYKDEFGWRIFGHWFYGDGEPAVRADIPIDGDVKVFDSCSPDCEDRTKCEVAGTGMHSQCGFCDAHNQPRHHCGCIFIKTN